MIKQVKDKKIFYKYNSGLVNIIQINLYRDFFYFLSIYLRYTLIYHL